MRRRLQESFHISPSGATLSHIGSSGVPSISVSVQTDPMMTAALNGNGHITNMGQTTLLSNGHLSHAANTGNNNPTTSTSNNHSHSHSHTHNMTYAGHSATLPHNAHLISHATAAAVHLTSPTQAQGDLEDVAPARGTIWSQSYRDVREVMATTTTGQTHSRENTLSRDNHHHSRDDGLLIRASCTQENLRSPSALGHNGISLLPNGHTSTHIQGTAAIGNHTQTSRLLSGTGVGDDLDEINTEYAESDVMLGGGGSGSSGGGSAVTNSGSGSGSGSAAGNSSSGERCQRY